MKKLIALFAVALFTTSAFATSDFCRGFEVGFKTVKGNMAFVPFCPFEPSTPFNSTPFQEGIKAGIKAAGG